MFVFLGKLIGQSASGSGGGNMQLSEFKKRGSWLYEASYNTLDYEFAKRYFDNRYRPVPSAGCSAVRNGSFFGRNFDWFYNEGITLVTKTAPGEDRFASIGVVGSVPGLTRSVAEGGSFSEAFMIAPFCLVDGINSEGLMCNINMLNPETSKGRTTGTEAAVEERERICMLMLVRYVLDHYSTVDGAVADLRDYVSVYAPDSETHSSEYHFMLADGTKTVILEFVNNEMVVTEVGPEEDYPAIMMNFYADGVTVNDDGTITRNTSDDPDAVNVNGVTPFGQGIERHNIAVNGYSDASTLAGMKALMRSLIYTQAYTLTSDNWFTEFLGEWDEELGGTLKVTSPDADFDAVLAAAAAKYAVRSRDPQSENYGTWQTVHTVVYDIAAKKLAVCVQEGDEYVEFSLDDSVGGAVDVQQGRGQSTTAVMSQKAVTDELTALEQNVGENTTAIETLESNKADKGGYYASMGVGYADNLAGRGSVPATFTHRPTAGTASVGSGAATIKALKGNTIVWNQLAQNHFSFETKSGITATRNGNKTRLQGTVTAQYSYTIYNAIRGIAGHKYLLAAKGITGGGWGRYGFYTNNANFNISVYNNSTIGTCTADGDYSIVFSIWAGLTIDLTISDVNTFDLTLMFGAGNEPSTVEEFEALFPLDYYAYNAGELVSFNGTGIKTDGFNQWDGSKARVFGGQAYYINGTYSTLKFAETIDGEQTDITPSSNLYTPTEDGYIFATGTSAEFCINLSHSGIRNGEYGPYWTETKQLPSLDFFDVTYTGADGQQHTEGGMKSAGTAHDEWNSTKKVRRIGVVDLGTQYVAYVAGNSYFQVTITDLKNKPYTSVDLFCPIYTAAPWSVTSDMNMVMRFSNLYNNVVWIRNYAYTDAASFKAAMAGVLLFYELAEPVEADAEPLGNYREDDYGTEALIPENDDEPTTAPIVMDVQYPMNAVDTLRNLPQNYQSQESMDAALTALGTALGFTFTKTWDATNGKWTYTITKTP